jgi:hypothetical protein
MAFGGPAIFSNDPNIGIRQMGLEGFIPTPVSSMTFKSRAGVDARRRGNYQNAPTGRSSAPPHKVVTNPDGTKMSVLLDGKKKGKGKLPTAPPPPSSMNPMSLENILMRARRFGYKGPQTPPVTTSPTVRVPTAAEIADGITRLEEQARNDEINYQKFGPGLGMKPKLKKDVGATDLPSTMFRGGAMFA